MNSNLNQSYKDYEEPKQTYIEYPPINLSRALLSTPNWDTFTTSID